MLMLLVLPTFCGLFPTAIKKECGRCGDFGQCSGSCGEGRWTEPKIAGSLAEWMEANSPVLDARSHAARHASHLAQQNHIKPRQQHLHVNYLTHRTFNASLLLSVYFIAYCMGIVGERNVVLPEVSCHNNDIAYSFNDLC